MDNVDRMNVKELYFFVRARVYLLHLYALVDVFSLPHSFRNIAFRKIPPFQIITFLLPYGGK